MVLWSIFVLFGFSRNMSTIVLRRFFLIKYITKASSFVLMIVLKNLMIQTFNNFDLNLCSFATLSRVSDDTAYILNLKVCSQLHLMSIQTTRDRLYSRDLLYSSALIQSYWVTVPRSISSSLLRKLRNILMTSLYRISLKSTFLSFCSLSMRSFKNSQTCIFMPYSNEYKMW